MNEVLCLRDCASAFLTRRQGEAIRQHLVEQLDKIKSMPNGHVLTIDFRGVDVMTPSFADECFGKFAERIGSHDFRNVIRLVGADPTVRALLNSVLSRRLSPGESPTT